MLQATRLTVRRGRRCLLDGLSLTLRPGEIVAVVGPNGAGKSTLLRVLSGELKPDGGRVTLNHRPLERWPLKQLARMRAVLPQSSTLAFAFRVLEVVQMGRSPHRSMVSAARDREIALAALEAVDAIHLAERIYTTLSGGERQRVQLARVLAQIWEPVDTPRYLLLDEPVSALDPAHQHHLLDLARHFSRQRNLGVLAVLHDLNLAGWYADRIAVIQNGRLVADGTPAEVLTPERIAGVFSLGVDTLPHPRDPSRPLVVVPGNTAGPGQNPLP